MNPRELLSFVFAAALVVAAVLFTVAGIQQSPAFVSVPSTFIDVVKTGLGLFGGFLIKLIYDAIKGRDRLKTAQALVAEELRQALATCDDKIDEWKARIANVNILQLVGFDRDPKTQRLSLYPTIATMAFESVASELTGLRQGKRGPIFDAYYYILRRKDNSERDLSADQILSHGNDAIVEISKIRGLIQSAIDALE